MRALPEGELGLLGFVRAALRSWPLLAVVATYLAGFALHAVALWLLPLYLAQASISLSLPVTAIVSAVALHERLDTRPLAGGGGVIAGLVLVAAGAGTRRAHDLDGDAGRCRGTLAAGPRDRRPALAGGMRACWARGRASATPGPPSRRAGCPPTTCSSRCSHWWSCPRSGSWRSGSTRSPCGRTDVASSTAPLIVMQTCIPAVVGVVAFGDTVRSGWTVAVVAGLALSVAGAIHLGRHPGSAAPARV